LSFGCARGDANSILGRSEDGDPVLAAAQKA
jgi:hypothetical protein